MENKNDVKWWQSLPGILSGIAALIVAITGLVVAIYQTPATSARDANNAPVQVTNSVASAVSVSGKWEAPAFTASDDIYIYLQQASDSVTGFYNDNESSKIVRGRYQNGIITAYWVEDKSNKKCSSRQIDNRDYWGKVEFTFNENLDRFSGIWGYCDESPDHKFIGRKVKND